MLLLPPRYVTIRCRTKELAGQVPVVVARQVPGDAPHVDLGRAKRKQQLHGNAGHAGIHAAAASARNRIGDNISVGVSVNVGVCVCVTVTVLFSGIVVVAGLGVQVEIANGHVGRHVAICYRCGRGKAQKPHG